ncbi:hypothetical protein, partial [Nocardia sp. NPDC004604]|uniref:hypothetical protein n=1 Tax=Nocardia sp. NPDC004604 TaxID=3157013 RepID=UPI0033B5C490
RSLIDPPAAVFAMTTGEFARAERVLADRCAAGTPDFVILVTAPGAVGNAAATAAGTPLMADLRAENG